MATRIEARTMEDGSTKVEFRPVSVEELQKLQGMSEGVQAEQSAARRRLEKRRAMFKSELVKVQYDGEDFYIASLCANDLGDLALSVSRDGFNVLQITSGEGLKSVMRAVLRACVRHADGSPYFEFNENDGDDAADYMASPSETGLVQFLFDQCCIVTPEIFSSLKNG